MLVKFSAKFIAFISFAAFLIFAQTAFAQTSAFTFQGKLNDAGAPANGTYQFEFKLFDQNGNLVGTTVSGISATVTNGIFAVNLDFGANSFDGTPRLLEIGVSLNGQNYTTLNPRQPISSTPYAVRSLKSDQAATANNALNLGGVAAAQFVTTNDPRLSDTRFPSAGSNSYIQNTLFAQSANFNIGGNGTVGGFLKAGTVNAVNQYQLNGERFVSAPSGQSIAIGIDAGDNATGAQNTFLGTNSGKAITSGEKNTFLGADSGLTFNTGSRNVAVGFNAGLNGSNGFQNTFVGVGTGFTSSSSNGASNTAVGANAAIAPNITGATAIGKEAFANADNMLALGSSQAEVLIRGTLEVDNETTFDGKVILNNLGAVGSTPLCHNLAKQISTCSGSFSATELEKQRELNQKLQEQIREQQTQIDALKALVCQTNRNAAICAAPENK